MIDLNVRSLKRPKLTDSIYGELLLMLRDGRLQPGQRLPPERELATAFGVSRSTVRNAVQRLSLLGYLEVRQGDGTTVKLPGEAALAQPFTNLLLAEPNSARDLLAFRRILEPEVARTAALYCEAADAGVLYESLERQADLVAANVSLADEDAVFHTEIVRIARNTIVVRVLDTLRELMTELRTDVLAGSDPPATLLQHQAIVDAITENNSEGAGAAMAAHIDWVIEAAQTTTGTTDTPSPTSPRRI